MNNILRSSKLIYRILKITTLLFSVVLLSSCGGGTQMAEGGIGGTGISTGTVTAFGSVYVNGVKYETTSTAFTGDDNEAGDQSGLSEGMVVTVKGTINSDGVTGTADSIAFEDLIEGLISAKDTNSLTVMGHTINVNSGTKYNGTDFASLTTDDFIEVSGFYDANNDITATYIESGSTSIQEITGHVTLPIDAGNSFTINGKLTVNSSATVTEGDYVEVKGSYSADVLTATSVDSKVEGFDISDEDVAELEGIVQSDCVYTTSCTFKLNGVDVFVDNNTVFESGLPSDIKMGSRLEVEGSLQGDILIAEEVEFEDDAEIEAQIDTVVDNTGTKTIKLKDDGGIISGLEIVVNSSSSVTEFDASSYAGITSGDHLKFRGRMVSGQLIANRVESGSAPDIKIEGIVDSFIDGVSVTVFGITVPTSGMTFTLDDGSLSGVPLTSAELYNHLQNNEAVIEIKGELISGTVSWTDIELDL